MRVIRFLNLRGGGFLIGFLALGVLTLAQNGGGRGFDPARLDKTCAPCEDFYQFANGNFLAKNPVPAAYPRWGSFDILADNNRQTLRGILEDAARNTDAPAGGSEQLSGAFYAACMNEARVEQQGAAPLDGHLARINDIKDLRGLQAVVADFHNQGVPTLFTFFSLPDAKNSTQVIGQLGQGGLSLPNRDYYTKTDEKSQKIREEYLAHVTRMFVLLGEPQEKAAASAKTVLALQTALANVSRAPVQLRDPNAQYNKMTLAQLKQTTPEFAWADYFAARKVPQLAEVNVRQPEFFKEVNRLFTASPLEDWKTYLRWHLATAAAPRLSRAFVDENFKFFNGVLQGSKEQLPRWRRCVVATDSAVGEALGQLYVKKAFTPASKARMQELIKNLMAVYRERLTTVSWMTDATRQQALGKLEAFAQKIGYPDKWRDYTGLEIKRDSYLDNALRAASFEAARNLKKIGKPVERTDWGMTPPTVNAYYSPSFNEIAFPAGILQPPFFNQEADDAINYGAIGAVIGHEITHGFDDQGSLYDAQGNLRMWWTPADRAAFETRAKCVIDQFSGYQVQEGLNVNGKLVAGESIADLGGLRMAYAALQKSMTGKPRPAEIDGFTPEQRFFLGYAQVWASNARPEYERLQVSNDPHPLPRFRANGPLSNMPEFAAAWGCKAGDKMVRPAAERCEVW